MDTRKSTPEASSTAEAQIFNAHRLLQNQKSLTKTELLQTHKSSSETSYAVAAEILSAHRLLQN
jgi:hypothetical protein